MIIMAALNTAVKMMVVILMAVTRMPVVMIAAVMTDVLSNLRGFPGGGGISMHGLV